jgi:hypothetical protein
MTKIHKKNFMVNLFMCMILSLLLLLTGCNGKKPMIKSFDPPQGNIGTSVNIHGENFQDNEADNTVKFGGVDVPTSEIMDARNELIIAKVPAAAKTGLISVETSEGMDFSKTNFKVTNGSGAKWTFMVYLDADNNLEQYGINDFLEMAMAGSNTDLKIVVQMDRIAGYDPRFGDWEGTRRFLVQQGDNPSIAPVQHLGEQNMGDPDVLQDFVEWAITNYPAQNYALVIWNHGHGASWRALQENLIERAEISRSRGERDTAVTRTIAWDETDNDKLYMYEVKVALQAAQQRLNVRAGTHVKIDLIGFDAGMMGMIEVAYALRNVANFVVGSEQSQPDDGWPYDAILGDLKAAPEASPQDLGRLIVTKYASTYPHPGNTNITQASVNIVRVNDLIAAIDAFSIVAISEWDKLKEARDHSIRYNNNCPSPNVCWGVDLWNFADEVQNRTTSIPIQLAAAHLKNSIDSFVVDEHHSLDQAGSHGIAIYFPSSQTEFSNDPEHEGYEQFNIFMPVDFVLFHLWDNWLQQYYSNIP